MRQVNIKELGKHLSAEMKNPPFAVMKRGKFIGAMVAPGITQSTDLTIKSTDNDGKLEGKGIDKPGSVHNPVETVRDQLVDIVKKRQKVLTKKSTIATGGTPFRPCPKKGKK